MRANKRDSNERELVQFFGRAGGYWQPCHEDQGHDGYLFYKHHVFAVEIKDGNKPPSAQKLTECEKRFKARIEGHGVRLWIIKSLEDAQALIEFRFKDIKER